MGPRLLEANLALDTQGKYLRHLAFFKGQSERIWDYRGPAFKKHLWASSNLSLEEQIQDSLIYAMKDFFLDPLFRTALKPNSDRSASSRPPAALEESDSPFPQSVCLYR